MTFINKQAALFTGIPAEKLTARGWAEVIHPDDLETVKSLHSDGVLAQAELALGELASGSSPHAELKAIRDAALRGSEIVRQLMIYAGRETAGVELVDVSQIAREMLDLLKLAVSKHAMISGGTFPPSGPKRRRSVKL